MQKYFKILMFGLLLGVPCVMYASVDVPAEESTETSVKLMDEIKNVKSYINTHDSVSLALAVGTHDPIVQGNEARINLRENWVLLSKEHRGGSDVPHLTVNFNDLSALRVIAHNLPNAFESIVMDFSSFKFTEWTKDHIQNFYDILKPGGTLILPVIPELRNQWETQTTDLRGIENEIIEYLSHKNRLSTNIPVMINLIPDPDFVQEHGEQVRQLVHIAQTQLLPLDEENEMRIDILQNNPDLIDESNEVIKKTEDYYNLLMENLYTKNANQKILSYTIEYNWKRIMGEIFGLGNVRIEEKGDHPFRSKSELLLIAQKL